MRIIRYAILLLTLSVVACNTDEETEEEVVLTEVNISLDSTNFQQVYDYIDQWQQDSLIPYLSHRDPSFRVLATGGFAGMMDEQYIDEVGKGILDPIVEVRRMAAYTLGQSRNVLALPHLMQVFENQDTLGIDPLTFKYALEAVGKCGDSSYLPLLAGITTYRPRDTLLLEGQALGILNLAEQGYADLSATNLMVRYATNDTFPASVRMIASNYLDRARGVDLSGYRDELTAAFETENDPNIRMFLGKAIGKSGPSAGPWIRRTMRSEEDDRVRVSLLQGCTNLPLNTRHGIWAGSLRDRNDLVAMTAADLILNFGSSAYTQTYTNWAFSNFSPPVYARLLAAGNKYVTNSRFHDMIEELILQHIRSANDPYIKSDFVMAAGYNSGSARQLLAFDDDNTAPVVRAAILESLVLASERGGSIGSREREFLINRWRSGDVAALTLLSPFFAAHPEWFPSLTSDPEVWTEVSQAIPMPQGIEGRIAVDQARGTLFDESYDPAFYRKASMHTHPIDWDLYQKLTDQPRAEIATSAGIISMELFKKEAPGTVLNFIQLAESGYYENRPIHRVVPNFVIQGGGNRGDGYGSLDYTIRSEVGPTYYDQSGMVGMASAGLHTESQQWFITLRPTLHLNGRYTIFGRLTSEEDVVRNTRRGDIIQSIKIIR